MADAGLTNGAFYAHFASKDDLVATTVADQRESLFPRYRWRNSRPWRRTSGAQRLRPCSTVIEKSAWVRTWRPSVVQVEIIKHVSQRL